MILLNGKVLIQQSQMVLGIQYTFSSLWQRGTFCKQCPQVKRDFVVTRDRNKKYHIFRHTSTYDNQEHSHLKRFHNELQDTCTNLTKQFHSRNEKSTNFFSKFCAQSSASGESDSVSSSRIVTYNIWNVNEVKGLNETYEDRLTRMGKHLVSMDADIIGFQEVRFKVPAEATPKKTTMSPKSSSNSQSQVTHLSQYLEGYEFVYQPAMLFPRQLPERNEEGVTIFSRYPIIHSDYILLYRNASDEHNDRHQRVCLHAEILTPLHGKIHVFVTHLSLSESSQERGVVEIWKFMKRFSGLKVLLGDLNAEPHSNPIRFLSGDVTLEGVRTDRLQDVWMLLNSTRNQEGFTFSALETPFKRIDYVFIHQPEARLVHVTEARVLEKDSNCYDPCSDHFALAVEMLPVHCDS